MTSRPRLSVITLALTFLAGISSPARAQDLPAPNTTAILKELDQVASGARNTLASRRNAALVQIEPAATSGPTAVDYYLKSLEETKYRENHQDFIDWHRKNEELLRSLSFQNAALMQLRYLTIALQRSEQHDALAQVPECLSYLNTLSTQNSLNSGAGRDSSPDAPSGSPGGKSGKNGPSQKNLKTALAEQPRPEALALVQQPLDQASVVQWLQLADLLPKGGDFEPSAGNYQGIMEKNVRVPLRAKNDPRLPGTWDTQIAMESAVATTSGSVQQAEEFNQNRAPKLLFNKAQDTAAIGQPNRALDEVMTLIRNYPNNPSVKEWIDAARKLIPAAGTKG